MTSSNFARHSTYEFVNFVPLNKVDLDAIRTKIEKSPSRMTTDHPEALLYADVTEIRTDHFLFIPYRRTVRTVRLFRNAFSLGWLYLDTGCPTPGYGVENAEMAHVARLNATRILTKL
jgi:hypothetical protein